MFCLKVPANIQVYLLDSYPRREKEKPLSDLSATFLTIFKKNLLANSTQAYFF